MTHDGWWTLQGEALYATESTHDASWLAWDCAQAAMRPEIEDLEAEVGRLEREAKRIVNAVLEISDAIEMEAYSIESSASAQAHDLASVRAKKDVIGRVLEAIST